MSKASVRTWQRRCKEQDWSPSRKLAALALLATATLSLLGLVRVELDTGISAFVPSNDPTYSALLERDDKFGSDPIVVALEADSSAGFLLDTQQLPLLLSLEGRLASLDAVAAVYGPATVLNQTAKGIQGMIARLSGERDALKEAVVRLSLQRGVTRKEAEAAARTAVVRFDRRYGKLIAKALPVGLPTLRNQVFVGNVVFDDRGESRSQWRFLVPDAGRVTLLVRPRAGLDQDALAVLIEDVRRTVDDAGLAVKKERIGGVPLVTTAVADKARGEMAVLGVCALVIVSVILLLIPWTRRRSVRLRPVLCAVLAATTTLGFFGWLGHPLSLGSVAFLPILFGVGSDYPVYLHSPVARRVVVAVAAAGAAAFASLGLAGLPFVRELGLALALGVAVTVSITFLMNTALGAPRFDADVEQEERLSAPWGRGVRLALAAAATATACVGWWGLAAAQVEASPESLAAGVPELEQTQRLGADLGFAGEVDVVIRGTDVIDPRAIEWSSKTQSALVRKHADELTPVISFGDLFRFLGTKPSAEQASAASELMPPYLIDSVASADRTWGMIVSGISETDVDKQAAFLKGVQRSLPPAPQSFETSVVGLPVVAGRALDLVSADRLRLNLAGALAAIAVLFLMLPHRTDALRATFTIAVAGGWLSGAATLFVGDLSPLTVAAGALVTVTACEFSVMLSAAHRFGSRRIQRTTRTAVLAGVAGYLVLLGSGLAVLREFGALLAGGVVLSLLAARLSVALFPPSPARGMEQS